MSLYVRDPVIGKLVRIIMKDGKKHCALRIVDGAFAILRQEHGVEQPCAFTKEAIDNAKPLVETRKYKASGRAIHVPIPCRPARQQSLAMRYLRDAFRSRNEYGSERKLAKELLDLHAKKGRTYDKREQTHRRAEENRSFSHFVR